MRHLVVATNVPVGDHVQVSWHGLTFNVDTILATVVAGVIVCGLGLMLARQVSSGVPGRLQIAWEAVSGLVQSQVDSTIGPVGTNVVPLGIALFTFILIANWIAVLPPWHVPEYLPPPASDVNFTYALGIIVVIIPVHALWIRRLGFRGYVANYFRKPRALFLLNMIEEIAKPISLSLRLFGNIFAGTILLALIAALFPAYIQWLPTTIWKLFDLFIGLIQAFIFTLLTILYFSSALVQQEGH